MTPVWAIALLACSAGYGGGDYGTVDGNPGGGVGDAGTLGCLSSSECPTGFVCNEFGRCEQPPPPPGDGGVPPPPPETETKISAPVSSQRFVYVAMTAQDELARIDGATLAVKATPVGEAPKVVAAIPHGDGAVVLDSRNGTITVVRPAGDTDTIRVLPTLVNLNRIDVDPSGRFAVVWFDLTKAIQEGGGIGGIGSFQDVTVVSLAQGTERVVNLTVGFRPREVQFDAAGNRAFVITQDGVSVINLGGAIFAGPSIVPPVPVADPAVAPEDLEVTVVATGAFAVVRQANSAKVRVVDLVAQPGLAREITLASPATDIDLAPDGSRAYVVQRAAKKLSIVDVPAGAIDPSGIVTLDLSDGTIGSFTLSPDGKRALLFTNATLDERVTMVKLDEPGFPHVTFPLKKAVRTIGISPDSRTAIVINAKAFGDPNTAGSVDEFIDRSFGYTVLDLATGFAKLQVTPVDPGSFAFSPDGAKAYVALDGGDADVATRALQVITTQTGVVITKQLGSPPSAVGIVPSANAAFTAQRHPLGRVSFIDLTTDQVRTVTGFDLNGHVVH
ncbi:MAG: hypothetical protein KIT31_30975 [Deltaproteobacteria bacterium]|nr:hypothetical protein [Deltaproteobacteria bacterium]